MTDELPMKGSCQCQQVSYEITEKPLALFACHCIECQKLSASAYSTTMFVRADALHVKGEMKRWDRMTDTGRRNAAYFCPGCGNRIYHQDPDNPTYARLKAGTLDNVKMPAPNAHLWVKRKQPWVDIPEGTPAYPENLPPDEAKKLFR